MKGDISERLYTYLCVLDFKCCSPQQAAGYHRITFEDFSETALNPVASPGESQAEISHSPMNLLYLFRNLEPIQMVT